MHVDVHVNSRCEQSQSHVTLKSVFFFFLTHFKVVMLLLFPLLSDFRVHGYVYLLVAECTIMNLPVSNIWIKPANESALQICLSILCQYYTPMCITNKHPYISSGIQITIIIVQIYIFFNYSKKHVDTKNIKEHQQKY